MSEFIPIREQQIDVRSLPRAVDVTESARQLCGIYFLLLDDEVVYVGQSVNCIGRISVHSRIASAGSRSATRPGDIASYAGAQEKNFNGAFVLEYPAAELDEMELHYIKLLRPRYNFSEARQKFYGNRKRPWL